MADQLYAPASPLYHRHWLLHYWRQLTGIALLVVVGFGLLVFGSPLGLAPWFGAVLWAMVTYLSWTWNVVYFTADRRLARRRGILGATTDLISPFGVISPSQTPFQRFFGVGTIHLHIPGPNVHIPNLAHFADFGSRLVIAEQQEQQLAQAPVQVLINFQGSPDTWPDGWLWLPDNRQERP
ncbi:MAG: PH domain-containing protein [Anaerolineaceae bacterium]|jgi:hypothetical protein|nr:PH domain-containing protein [Anaerolineaceae bacterium]